MAVNFSNIQNMLDTILANSRWAQGQSPPLQLHPYLVF